MTTNMTVALEQYQAKQIVNDKFWILEKDGVKVGTISRSDSDYLFTSGGRTIKVRDLNELSTTVKIIFTTPTTVEEKVVEDEVNELHGYPTNCNPFNVVFDVQNKFPIFTKRAASDIQYCAGYFIIKFDTSWTKSFCPKLTTLEKYTYQGPFKSKLEMNERLRINRNVNVSGE